MDSYLKDRDIDAFMGLCRGILFDGSISLLEATNLYEWLLNHPEIAGHWIARELYQKLVVVLQDGKLDSDEEKEVLTILAGLADTELTLIPTTPNPPNKIIIDGYHFALTGIFKHRPRKDIEKMIVDNGGHIKKNANSNCHYLIIADIANPDYRHSSFGRKIEEATKTYEKGYDIHIIREAYFLDHL